MPLEPFLVPVERVMPWKLGGTGMVGVAQLLARAVECLAQLPSGRLEVLAKPLPEVALGLCDFALLRGSKLLSGRLFLTEAVAVFLCGGKVHEESKGEQGHHYVSRILCSFHIFIGSWDVEGGRISVEKARHGSFTRVKR